MTRKRATRKTRKGLTRKTAPVMAQELVKHRRILEKLHQLAANFRELHQRGIEALKARDYRTLSDVIKRERGLILRQNALIQRSREVYQRSIDL